MPASLAVVADDAATCTRCSLATGRTNVVFGMGDPANFAGELLWGGGEPMAQMRADLVRAKQALANAGSPLATSPTGTDR